MKKVGIIINPVAGLGGSVALKGSDGAEAAAKAVALGAEPMAALRTRTALIQLANIYNEVEFLTCGGSMGEDTLRELELRYRVVHSPQTQVTTPEDTKNAAAAMLEEGAELIMFAGGDGTARDICAAVGTEITVIGIPAGVKIHSAVYALNPRNAGLAALEYLISENPQSGEAEVMDIDEEEFRQGRVRAKLYGYMNIPAESTRMQNTKSPNVSEGEELLDIAAYIADEMEEDILYFIGPGSTTRKIKEELGIDGTLLGVDAVLNGELVAKDVSERQIWELVEKHPAFRIVVTVIGGQGVLFGRGNQQFSPRILNRAGRKNIIVAATHAKIRQLMGRPLIVDTGDSELDEALSGYTDIVAGYEQTVFYRISC